MFHVCKINMYLINDMKNIVFKKNGQSNYTKLKCECEAFFASHCQTINCHNFLFKRPKFG